MDEEDKVQRSKILGFSPQKENIYNKLLPYADKLDEESTKLYQDIKTNLVKSILAKEMRPGCALWTSRLNKYMKVYGLKFSKEDHITLIKLFYELLTIPNLEPTRINKCASTLQFLLKKRHLISPEELQLEWRPLYELCIRVMEKSKNDIGMYRYFSTLESTIETLIRVCRIYFPVEATQEILDQFRPQLCPYSSPDITNAIEYLELFIPVIMKPEQAHLGYKLWLEELMNLWEVCHNASLWENRLAWLMARIANFNIGYIDWEPYIPIMFVRFLRTLQLPVRYRQKQSGKQFKIDGSAMAIWIVSILGGKSDTAFFHLEKFMQTLESYYHPANTGKWTTKIREVLKKLTYYFVERVHIERYRKPNWENQIPDDFKLTDSDIDRFVNILKPCVEQAMFSRQGSQDVTQAMQYLAALRPNIIIPIVLEKLYASMDSLTEPHKLTSSLLCTMAVTRFMVAGAANKYPEGPTHVVPLLFALLPGIDPNDIHKCLMSFNLISHLANLAPFIDCSEASKYYSDLTEEEHIICEATASFEDFVVQFLDRIFSWVESNSLEFIRMEQNDIDQKSKLEAMSESALFSVFTTILHQCSPQIFMTALKKVHDFATNRILESKVSGKLVALLCSCFAKTNPKESLKLFLPNLCDTIENLLNESEDAGDEEHLNDELSYNLLLLSEIVDTNGHVMHYIDRLNSILERTLHMKSVQGNKLSVYILSTLMTSLTLIQPIEYRSLNISYDTHVKDFLAVRHWATPGNLKDLKISWYVPGEQEVQCVQNLINKYLVPEIDKLNRFAEGKENLQRNELVQSLRIVSSILSCQSILPQWKEPALNLVDSVIEPWAFELIVGGPHTVQMPDGSNIRKMVADTMHKVQKKILETDEGDTRSLQNVVQIYDILLFNKYRGRNFEMHWKTFHNTKKFLENRLQQKKAHLRYILIDRIMLHQEFRNDSRSCSFTETHKQILLDLYELGISRYSDIRKSAQAKLFNAISTFPYSYNVLVPNIKQTLQLDTGENHEKFKGCLHILMGPKATPIVTRHDWAFIRDLWPLLIKSQPSEKPSIVNLMNNLSDCVKRYFPTIAIRSEITEKCLELSHLLASNTPEIDVNKFEEVIRKGEEYLKRGNQERKENYIKTVNSLLEACTNGNLHWRHYSMALGFLRDIVHPDVKYSPEVVHFFLQALINESIGIRKIALKVVLFILIQNKPKFIKKQLDLETFGITNREVVPGIRSDNQWLLYNSKTVPKNETEWNKMRFIHKQYIGFYTWPKTLEMYAPPSEQPSVAKRMDQMTPQEKEIYDFFSDSKNVKMLIKYFSMEEKKGKDQFNAYRFLIFKNLFKMFEDKLLHMYIPYLSELVQDTQEQSQRCAAEIISGVIRGCKHWNYDQTVRLWSELIPLIRVTFSNFSTETTIDWGLCIAMALDSRDPNRYHWLLEFLMDNPLAEQTSFISCVRIYLLQNALHQQSWRNAELVHRLLEYFKNNLTHPFQNVREKISNCLTTVFCKDIVFPDANITNCPRVCDFFVYVMPRLNELYEHILNDIKTEYNRGTNGLACKNFKLNSIGDKESKEEAIRLFKTVSKYITGSVAKINYSAVPEYYELLPLACVLQGNDNDDELESICSNLLAVLGHSLILDRYLPAALDAIRKVISCPFWSARLVVAEFIPVLVFHNKFTIVSKKEWIDEIQNIALKLLEDSQPEVRFTGAKFLSGLLHCQFIPDPLKLLAEFKKKSKALLKGKGSKLKTITPIQVKMRHSAVLGLCAFISAHPYDVPDYLPDVFHQLGPHLNDPEPIPSTIRQTLGDFKRTHHDNWEVHKLRFTEDELSVLSDLTVPPSYYA